MSTTDDFLKSLSPAQKKLFASLMTESSVSSSAAVADPINPELPGFSERITPKEPEEDKLFFFQCPNCQGYHFRHAGYVSRMIPYMRAGSERRIEVVATHVDLCVACKHSFVWINEQMYDITDKIDLEAWKQSEVEAQAATGPGGQC